MRHVLPERLVIHPTNPRPQWPQPRSRGYSVIEIALILLIGALAGPATAQLSPGKLSDAHSELEGITRCTQCHDVGQAISGEKCLTCHTAIREHIDRGEGYHAGGEVDPAACAVCHAEHHGRDYDLIYWPDGREAFDHDLAGWPLQGAHARQECSSCHQQRFHDPAEFDDTTNPERTYLGLDPACVTCHADEHGEQLANGCTQCHGQEAWSPAPGFDHAEDSEYALTGRHTELLCEKCHTTVDAPPAPTDRLDFAGSVGVRTSYKPLAFADCSACHEDPHAGKFTRACADCHTTQGFRMVGRDADGDFDHSRTGFPLDGLHGAVRCDQCHTSGRMTDDIAHDACADCHEDEHRGQFSGRDDGGACDACHTVDRPFRRHEYTLADHAASAYPLTGSHRAIPCFLCHLPVEPADGDDAYARFTFDDTRCQACHEDIHQGQLDIWVQKNGCDYCHSTETWHRTRFDHSLARFPLEGRHREILCLDCHRVQGDAGEELVWMKPLEMTCTGCHTEDSPHAGQFLANGTAKSCDDCHQPAGWKELEFDHERDTEFPLTGGHQGVDCRACHLIEGDGPVHYRGLPRDCAACHGSGQG